MDTKKWYQSKIVWSGIVVTVLGILPIVNIFVKVVAPQTAVIMDAVGALIAGILTVVWRIWFTNEEIIK